MTSTRPNTFLFLQGSGSIGHKLHSRTPSEVPLSKQHVADKIADVLLNFTMVPDDDDEFAGKIISQDDPPQLPLVAVEGERANGYEADAEAEGHEIDDQIKAIELHGRFDPPALFHRPGFKPVSGVGALIDLQPVLPVDPIVPALG